MATTLVVDAGDAVLVGNPVDSGAAAFALAADPATPADPTGVTLRVENPAGSVTTYRWPTPGIGESALTRESVGRFYAAVTPVVSGRWDCELAGTGTVEAMAQWSFYVRPNLVPA